jgi:hypothetical protein
MALTFKQEAALRAMQGLVTGCNDYDPDIVAKSAWELAEIMNERRKQDEAKCFGMLNERKVDAA